MPITGPCVPCSVSISFQSNVASGDVVLVGLQYPADSPPSSVTDSLGSSYNQAVATAIIPPGNQPAAAIYDATLDSNGANTVTVDFPTHSLVSVYIFEVRGVTTTGVETGSGIGTFYGQISTNPNPVSFPTGAFLLGMMASLLCESPQLAAAGTGFTLVNENSGPYLSGAEYSTSGVSSPTFFPATQSGLCINIWAEVGAAFNPKLTTTTSVNCHASVVGLGSSTTCTATVTGASGSISGETISWSQSGGTGSVTFPSGTTCALSGASCSITVNGASVGSPMLQASYPGDSNNAASSGTFSLTVNPGVTTTTTTAPPIPEYPLGLPILTILMIIAYGLVKRRTMNPNNL